MFGDDGFHVWCATVADLECVCIEYLVVFALNTHQREIKENISFDLENL